MQIQNILSGYTDPTMKRHAEQLDAVAGRIVVDQGTAAPGPGPSTSEAARRVLEKYDVTQISPRQLSEMIQRLFDAGAIAQQEFDQLAAIRLDLDTAGIDPDESIDLLRFYRDKIDEIHRRNPQPDAGPDVLRSRLDWIEKFALVQASPGAFGLDAVA